MTHDKIDWRQDSPNITMSHHPKNPSPMWDPPSEEVYQQYLSREVEMCVDFMRWDKWRRKQEDTLFSFATWTAAIAQLGFGRYGGR